ncbi:MAG: hypothetical protein JWO92_716 [Chitinophagaceae bacterium]|nr:hypothetical protein [Chitinophagaceae bacterium]
MKIKFSLITILMLVFSGIISAQVIFKNTGWSKVRIAICYYNNVTGWTSKGWYTIAPDEQKPLYNFTILNNPNFYYCATIDDCDKGYAGDFPLYVDTRNSFTISNADRDANYVSNTIQKYKFVTINLKGRSNYIIELNPRNLKCNGKPQGKWRLSLDRDGNYAEKKEDAEFFREITFDEGRPLGWCKDYYRDGKVKAEFKLKNYDPVIYEGKCTWYKPDGSVEREENYNNGAPTTVMSFASNGSVKEKKAHYEVIELPVQNFYLNSTSNETWKGGRSKTVLPVTLPESTVEWYYEFTASRNEDEVRANTQLFNLAAKLTSLIDKTGILPATINMFTAPAGGNKCDVYLIDRKYYNTFLADGDFKYNLIGSRLNYNSGIVQIRNLNITQPVIGIKNPDGYDGIHVSLQVAAVVSKIE